MDPIEKAGAVGSAAIIVSAFVLFLIGAAIIFTSQSPEKLLREVPGAGPLTEPIVGTQDDAPAEHPPPDGPPAGVAAASATPAPARRAAPSATPTPGSPRSTGGPVAPLEALTREDAPAVQAPGVLPLVTPQPPGSPAAAPGGPPPPDATPAPVPTTTPVPTPFDACLQPESTIAMDHNRLRIERASLILYDGASLVVSTVDGPVSLVMTLETQVLGDLGTATQVRVEAHRTGSGKVIGDVVQVLCP